MAGASSFRSYVLLNCVSCLRKCQTILSLERGKVMNSSFSAPYGALCPLRSKHTPGICKAKDLEDVCYTLCKQTKQDCTVLDVCDHGSCYDHHAHTRLSCVHISAWRWPTSRSGRKKKDLKRDAPVMAMQYTVDFLLSLAFMVQWIFLHSLLRRVNLSHLCSLPQWVVLSIVTS